jgi:hypothetical protein
VQATITHVSYHTAQSWRCHHTSPTQAYMRSNERTILNIRPHIVQRTLANTKLVGLINNIFIPRPRHHQHDLVKCKIAKHRAWPESTSWDMVARPKRRFAKTCRELGSLDRNCFHANRMGCFVFGNIAARDVSKECRYSCSKEWSECHDPRHYTSASMKRKMVLSRKCIVLEVGKWRGQKFRRRG